MGVKVLAIDNVVEGNQIGTDSTGTVAISNATGIEIDAGSNTIGGSDPGAGNLISGNLVDGILLAGVGAANNLVAGNRIGTDVTGNAELPNTYGILIAFGPANTIGGTDSGAGNLISGNSQRGISVDGSTATAELIEGNRIGTNAPGTVALSDYQGVVFEAPGNTLGGTAPGAGNLISGNAFQGIGIGVGGTDNLIEGNLIGTDAAGTAIVGNGAGVAIGQPGNTVGGSVEGAGNVISGNGLGVYIASSGNLVERNRIGTSSMGSTALPNGTGILLDSGAVSNTIGGTDTGDGNLISGNTDVGVRILDSDNLVEGNRIGTDSTGAFALANLAGLSVGSSGNTIGGTAPGAGNLISGNSVDGIYIFAPDNLVEGNSMGTNAAGSAALANGGAGVSINSTGNTIGGLAAGAGNLLSGNLFGLYIAGAGNLIAGNRIGTDSTGEFGLGNTGPGVDIIDAPDNTIGGPTGGARNLISGNNVGVLITDALSTGTVVAGNLIGTNATGTAALGNLTAGITLWGGSGTTIGGSSTLARNVISGNTGAGVDIEGGATSTVIEGNYVGVDQTGTQPLGNAGSGLAENNASGATIGGTAPGSGNVFSANAQSGLMIQGSGASAVVILGNLIGTDSSGSFALGNVQYGVLLDGTSGVALGGTAAGDRNIISANTVAGVGILGGSTGAAIEGNLIGTDVLGTNPLGNGTGVFISGGSSNNTIGGVSGAGNSIAFSAGIGVDVDATAGAGNDLRLNSIFSNTGLGIDLGGDGVTLNDSVLHSGPNEHQNFPVITGVMRAGGTTTVTGTMKGAANTTLTLDFYTLSAMNGSGYGEGRYLLGSTPLAIDATGLGTFSSSFATPPEGAEFVTATATDAAGNTSEFSKEFGSNHPPLALIGFTTMTVNEGVAIPFDGRGSTDPDGDPLSYSWSFGDGATAVGTTPFHVFTNVGTDTVTLTVSDGFGGTNEATAAVKVEDVPPAFVPGSFTPPQSFQTPTAGDGFGAAVAAVDGNVAVGARFDIPPGSTDHAGLAYLYDGVPTDDGSSTTYVYGTLIHVFADPNPAAGDEFGASIAAVGNDLLIGAPEARFRVRATA